MSMKKLYNKYTTFPGEEGEDGVGEIAKDNISGISNFYYRYNGSIGGNSFTYSVEKENESVIFTYESMLYPELGKVKKVVDDSILNQLDKIYKDLRICEWDGYFKYNTFVFDGDGFTLRIKFNDGEELRAEGTNAFPNRYRDFYNSMCAILDPIRDSILKENNIL